MLFNSLAFAVFLPLVFLIYWAAPQKYRYIVLLISSYYFYMSWNAKYVVLILFTTGISYLCAVWMEKFQKRNAKRMLMAGAVAASLLVLFFFKYFDLCKSIKGHCRVAVVQTGRNAIDTKISIAFLPSIKFYSIFIQHDKFCKHLPLT